MKATDLMTSSPCCCSENDSARDVARLMRDHDCGSIPVVDRRGLVVGIVTDRDLVVRAFADDRGLDTKMKDVMTTSPHCCDAGDDIHEVERAMADHQVRRVPILDGSGSCVGIISQADLARAAERRSVDEHELASVVERISAPTAPLSSRRSSPP